MVGLLVRWTWNHDDFGVEKNFIFFDSTNETLVLRSACSAFALPGRAQMPVPVPVSALHGLSRSGRSGQPEG